MTHIIQGYAVTKDGVIDIRTVSSTGRGAVVEWLLLNSIPVSVRYHSDADVEQKWRDHQGSAKVIPVIVTAKQ